MPTTYNVHLFLLSRLDRKARRKRLGFRLPSPVRWIACCFLLSIPLLGQDEIVLAGSGSSLAGPLMTVWAKEFNRQQSTVRVSYVATNSSDGLRAIARHSGDFAIGEIPLTEEQRRDPNLKLAQIPIGIVGVTVVYNLSGIAHLRFTGELLAHIYMGSVTNWNDGRIAALNPSVILPRLPIVVVTRPTGSGARYILTDFLLHSSPEFRAWMEMPRGRETKSNAATSKDMVEQIALTPGALGYVDQDTAARTGLHSGSVENRSGKFVDASAASVIAACEAKTKSNSQLPKSLVDAEGENSYPVSVSHGSTCRFRD